MHVEKENTESIYHVPSLSFEMERNWMEWRTDEKEKIFLEIGERIGGTNPPGGIASKLAFGHLGS